MGINLPDLSKYREKIETFLYDISEKMTWKRWTAAAAIMLIGLFLMGLLLFGGKAEKKYVDKSQIIYISVKSGMSASDVGDELVRHGVLEDKLTYWWKVKLSKNADKFKAGMYAFSPYMTADEVLKKLVNGETTTVKFTIPEGFGVKDIAERLDKEGIVDKEDFLNKAKDYAPYDYIKRDKDIRYACEGFLFPDTFEIHDAATVDSILKMMSEDFDNRLTPEMRARAEEMGLSIFELVTLASLVEKEARFDEDRPIIAQVFLKRLSINMPLQSDTTLQYLLDGPKEDLSIEDTKIASPYNTYQNTGLPPGPIANPGIASIKAVLYPADTDYLYFVADRNGHNHYTTNYSDHLAVVDEVR